MLKGKHVLLGVTGGIASYKIATLASLLVKAQADVHVIIQKTLSISLIRLRLRLSPDINVSLIHSTGTLNSSGTYCTCPAC